MRQLLFDFDQELTGRSSVRNLRVRGITCGSMLRIDCGGQYFERVQKAPVAPSPSAAMMATLGARPRGGSI
jgi:hypothetical protein